MENEININLGPAQYSLAMIEFKQYTDLLANVETSLSQPSFLVANITSRKQKTEDLAYVLKKYALPDLCSMQKHLKAIKKQKAKHITRVEPFLMENPDKREDFDAAIFELDSILSAKEEFVNAQIQKCFEYINETCMNVTT